MTSTIYPQRVRENILPLSVSTNMEEVFKEWVFTEVTEDYGSPSEICELCDKDHLRYHFQITNVHTKYNLNVGSDCIQKFEVPVYDNGKILSKAQTKQKLDKLVRKMHEDSCTKALEALVKIDKHRALSGALSWFNKNKKLSPNYAEMVFRNFNQRGIDYDPKYFKISMSSTQHKEDLSKMNQTKIKTVWPALTTTQRESAIGFGVYPPA